MSDFERDEEKLKEILKPLADEKPPPSLMKDFEKQVIEKIETPSLAAFPVMGVSFAALLVFALAFGFFLVLKPKPVSLPTVAQKEVPQEEVVGQKEFLEAPKTKEATKTPLTVVSASIEEMETLMASLADDLFILEMLGEDEGLMEDIERLEMDMEFLPQSGVIVA